jgi:hypothetical protein
MATTTYGSPYVQSSDLVSGWPTASQNVANRIDDVALKGNGVNAQTGAGYTLVLTDAGKTYILQVRVNQSSDTRGDHASAEAGSNRALDELRGENTSGQRNNVTNCRAGVWREFSEHFVLYHFCCDCASSEGGSADQGFFAYQHCN